VGALELAKRAGSAKAGNVALVGAASRYIPLKAESLEAAIRERFASKGEKLVEANIAAFRMARGAA
ncbi:MAG: 2-oxoacid:acceptor oxidoreductase family protein, partial [Spirochaetales bacterium]|nr:2-oxoacid:acceptor oxidoreductase family protein [Spirochaetales bacterium]